MTLQLSASNTGRPIKLRTPIMLATLLLAIFSASPSWARIIVKTSGQVQVPAGGYYVVNLIRDEIPVTCPFNGHTDCSSDQPVYCQVVYRYDNGQEFSAGGPASSWVGILS